MYIGRVNAPSILEETNSAAEPNRPGSGVKTTWPRRFGHVLFFMMLVVPTTYQPIKLGLLLLCLVAIVAARPQFRINPRIALCIIIVSAIGAAEVLYGQMRGNQGALSTSTVWILWPIVFLILASSIISEDNLRSLFTVMVLAAGTIGLYGCLMALALTGRIPGWLYVERLDVGQGFYYQDGVFSLSLNSLTSMLFLTPFLIVLAFTWPRNRKPAVPWPVLYMATILSLSLILLSGRRALLIGVLLAPMIILGIAIVGRSRISRIAHNGAIIIGVSITSVLVFRVRVNETFDYLLNGSVKVASNRVRSGQFHQLMDGWSQHPLLGAGLGGVADGPVRNFETPWAYELSYVAMLFQLGVLGLLFYSAVLALLLRAIVRMAREDVRWRPFAVPVATGYVSFLIGNATNPYLLKFDSMWVLFLPVALLNVGWLPSLRGQKSSIGKESCPQPSSRLEP